MLFMADRIPPELDNEIKCVQEKGDHFIKAVQELSDEEILSSIRKVYLEGNFQCEILLLLNSPVRIKCLFLQNVYFFHQTAPVKTAPVSRVGEETSSICTQAWRLPVFDM